MSFIGIRNPIDVYRASAKVDVVWCSEDASETCITWVEVKSFREAELAYAAGNRHVVVRHQHHVVQKVLENMDKVTVSYYTNDWEDWNIVRTKCQYSTMLFACILLDEVDINLWEVEPLSAVLITANMMSINEKGHRVLSRKLQHHLDKYINRNCGLTVFVDDLIDVEYIEYLLDKLEIPQEAKYVGALLPPLQPLRDNLDDQTYQVFEEDYTKYDLYEQAVSRAVDDLSATHDNVVIVMAGAGRGNILDRVYRVSKARSDLQFTIYAIEKNPLALRHLSERNKAEWQGDVILTDSDMRLWKSETPVNMVISELLGSFGDNELSPECLKHFKADIFIPQSYSSFIAPCMAPKLHQTRRAINKFQPFVVDSRSFYLLSTPKLCWSFTHPSNMVNFERRYTDMFHLERGVVHGFAGFFQSCLYGDVELSTVPDSRTEGLNSWWPMWFPIGSPFEQSASSCNVLFSRCTTAEMVWYEWSLAGSQQKSQICNESGQDWNVGVS